MAGNQDVKVNGSSQAARDTFLKNAYESAQQGDLAGCQYWYELAAQADDIYPDD